MTMQKDFVVSIPTIYDYYNEETIRDMLKPIKDVVYFSWVYDINKKKILEIHISIYCCEPKHKKDILRVFPDGKLIDKPREKNKCYYHIATME